MDFSSLLPAQGWELQAWKATSVSPLQSPTLPLVPASILRLLVLDPGPHVAEHPPQLPQADHWQLSPGNGEQKSQSPLKTLRTEQQAHHEERSLNTCLFRECGTSRRASHLASRSYLDTFPDTEFCQTPGSSSHDLIRAKISGGE